MWKGKSKKLAKKVTAQNMWERFHEIPGLEPVIFTGSNDADNEEMANDNLAANYADLKDGEIMTPTAQYKQVVVQFQENLWMSSDVKLNEFQNTALNDASVNFVDFLQEIATEQQVQL